MKADVQIFENELDLANGTVNYIIERSKEAISERGLFTLVLPGGSTPRLLYKKLSSDDYKDQIEWGKVHLFWGDERCISIKHPDSNYRMINESLINNINIPIENVHFINSGLAPSEAASEYEEDLRYFWKKNNLDSDFPSFDLILLGLGIDGHTASLFPKTEALNEKNRWVVCNYVPKLDAYRITLTFPVINSAKNIAFLVSGKSKSKILNKIFNDDSIYKELPIHLIKPKTESIKWFVDKEAMEYNN